jgi:hypothetical protein
MSLTRTLSPKPEPQFKSPTQGLRRPRLSSFRCNCQTAWRLPSPKTSGSQDFRQNPRQKPKSPDKTLKPAQTPALQRPKPAKSRPHPLSPFQGRAAKSLFAKIYQPTSANPAPRSAKAVVVGDGDIGGGFRGVKRFLEKKRRHPSDFIFVFVENIEVEISIRPNKALVFQKVAALRVGAFQG